MLHYSSDGIWVWGAGLWQLSRLHYRWRVSQILIVLMFWVSYMLDSPKAFFLSRRAPTATFHDSKHSIIHMQYEPTRGWLLTSGTDKTIKVSTCYHSIVSVLFAKEIVLICGVFTFSYGTWLQWYHENPVYRLKAGTKNQCWTWTENHVFVESIQSSGHFPWAALSHGGKTQGFYDTELSMCICMYLCMRTRVMGTNV